MSKKNSNVNLKNGFERFKDLSEIYQKFKIKLLLYIFYYKDSINDKSTEEINIENKKIEK